MTEIDRGTYSDGTPRQKYKFECRYHPVSKGYKFLYGGTACRHCIQYVKGMQKDVYYD